MRLLADESCDRRIVSALRSAGHDVVEVAVRMPGAADADVLSFAREAELLLVTEDKDFGQLVFALGSRSPGVVLLRYPAPAWKAVAQTLVALLERRGEGLRAAFATVEPGRARVVRAPTID